MLFVEQVGDIGRQCGLLGEVIAYGGIHHDKAARLACGVAVAVVIATVEPRAQPNRQITTAKVFPCPAGPDRGDIFRHQTGAVADVAGGAVLFDLGIQIAVGGGEGIGAHLGFGFQIDAADTDFTDGFRLVGRRIGAGDVAFRQVIDRGRQQRIGSHGLPFRAQLKLLALFRLDAKACGHDRLRVVPKHRNVRLDLIGQTHAACRLADVVGLHRTGEVVGFGHVDPVVTQPEGGDETFVPVQLLLKVERLAFRLCIEIGKNRHAGGTACVAWVVAVNRRRRAIKALIGLVGPREFDPRRGGAGRPAKEALIGQMQVGDHVLARTVAGKVRAVHHAVIRGIVADIGIAEVIRAVAVAQGAAKAQPVAKVMRAQNGNGGPFGAAVVIVRLAVEHVAAVKIAARRETTAAGHGVAVKVIDDHGQLRRIGGTPCEATHRKDFVVLGIGVLKLAVAQQAGETVAERAFFIQRVAEIHTGFQAAVGIHRGVDTAKALVARALGDIVDRAAGVGQAKGRRRRAPDDFHTLKGKGLFADGPKVRAQCQPIAVGIGLEPAQNEIVEPVVRAIAVGAGAGGVVQHLLHAIRAARFDLAAGDDRDAGRDVDDLARQLTAAAEFAGDYRFSIRRAGGLRAGLKDHIIQLVGLLRVKRPWHQRRTA